MIVEPLRYHVTDRADRTVIRLAGEVDISHADELRSLLTVTGFRAQFLEVDLSEVVFIDARGVSVLLVARSDAVAVGRRLAVTNPTGHIRRVLELIGVLALLVEENPSRLPVTGTIASCPVGWRPSRRRRAGARYGTGGEAAGRRPRLAGCGGSRGAVRRPATTCRPTRPIQCLRVPFGDDGHLPDLR
jgi:anti-anti-sigma factor